MTTNKKDVERWKHKRYKPKTVAYAVLASDTNRLGPIKEISKGGLAFEYIDSGEPIKDPKEVEIFSTDHDFYLKKLPIKTTVESDVDTSPPFSSLPVKQLRLQFGEMTPVQARLLYFFLQHCTHG